MLPESTRTPTLVAEQRRGAHSCDEAVHHLVLGLGKRLVQGLVGAHHLVTDGANRLEEFRIEELRRVVRGETGAAADKTSQEQNQIGLLVGRRPQSEFGITVGGSLHQPCLGSLDNRSEVAAHCRLQIRDGAAGTVLEAQAGHTLDEGLSARQAPDVDGKIDVFAFLSGENRVPEFAGESLDAGARQGPVSGEFDVGPLERSVEPLSQHGFMTGHDELVAGAFFIETLAQGQMVGGVC
jgi:hypothetical protein